MSAIKDFTARVMFPKFSAQLKVKPWSQDWLIAAGAYPGFCSMKQLKLFLLPLDGMLVHHRSLPRNLLGFPQRFAGTHVYTWVKRGTVRVKCFAQEHNTMSPARARTRIARSGVERTNHEATAPPRIHLNVLTWCEENNISAPNCNHDALARKSFSLASQSSSSLLLR